MLNVIKYIYHVLYRRDKKVLLLSGIVFPFERQTFIWSYITSIVNRLRPRRASIPAVEHGNRTVRDWLQTQREYTANRHPYLVIIVIKLHYCHPYVSIKCIEVRGARQRDYFPYNAVVLIVFAIKNNLAFGAKEAYQHYFSFRYFSGELCYLIFSFYRTPWIV